MKPVALASSERSGVTMTVHSNQPGVQFYTGNFLTGSHHGKGGAVYDKHAGFCLETQKYPDAINKTGFEGWPSVILRPGESYYHEVVYGFATNRS
jgi:aldose 1-epimerase